MCDEFIAKSIELNEIADPPTLTWILDAVQSLVKVKCLGRTQDSKFHTQAISIENGRQYLLPY
jgi:hypothetical protein